MNVAAEGMSRKRIGAITKELRGLIGYSDRPYLFCICRYSCDGSICRKIRKWRYKKSGTWEPIQ